MSDTSFVLVVGMATFFILAILISGWPHTRHMTSPTVTWPHPTVTWPQTVTWSHTTVHDLTCHMTSDCHMTSMTVTWPLQLSHDCTQLSHDLTDCHMTSQLSHDLTQLSHDLTTVTWPHTNVTWPHKTVTWPSLIRGGLLGRKKENSDNSCCYEKSIVWFLVFW